ncbi:hypothetical protein [Lacrimispora sp. 38-1]|uniref:hypothetical protein n=1 Tax=Lacrimispora sp. 38-1 TaxID=3125778 RepID=UPI003CE69484
MLTKVLRILWVKVNISGDKHFYLNLPISLYAFGELLDCVTDLFDVVCFFVPRQQLTSSSSFPVHTLRSLMKGLTNLMDSLVCSESYELVNVDVENVKVSVKIR